MFSGTNDDLGQRGFLGFGFRHPVYLSRYSAPPPPHPSRTHARAFFTSGRPTRATSGISPAGEEFPIRRAIVAFAAAAHLGGRRGEGRMRRRRRRHDSHADRHRRESRAGERITRPGTGSSLTTTTAKIRASPVASLFPLHRWEEEREREGGCGCVQRLSLKSVTAESRASLPLLSSRSRWEALLASLCRADRSGAAALTRSFGRGRSVGDSLGRRTTDCALFLRCRPGCGVKNDSDRQTQRMR